MVIATTNEVAGYEISDVLGEVYGITVRSRHLGSQLGAALKSVVGGELRGMTRMVTESRDEAVARLREAAEAKGADAVVAFRFDASELGSNWTEICAYGTAVKLRRP